MIVRDHPPTLKLFFVMQGSVVPKIIGKIIGIALFSVLVMVLDQTPPVALSVKDHVLS